MNRVWKYPTGGEIPTGAQYLSTEVEEFWASASGQAIPGDGAFTAGVQCQLVRLVWHYFLVDDGTDLF